MVGWKLHLFKEAGALYFERAVVATHEEPETRWLELFLIEICIEITILLMVVLIDYTRVRLN